MMSAELSVCLALMLAIGCLGDKNNVLELSPKNINAILNGTITATCSVKGMRHRGAINASSLIFTFEKTYPVNIVIPVNKSFVTRLNGSSVLLIYPNVPTDLNNTVLYCSSPACHKLRKGKDLCEAKSDGAHTCVGFEPFRPRITEHVVKNWKTLEFSWENERRNWNYVYITHYTAWYKTSNMVDFRKCDKQDDNAKHCTIELASFDDFDFDVGNTVVIKVNASSVVGNSSSSEVIVTPNDIVWPGPVENLNVTLDSKKDTARIQFSTPRQNKLLTYSISANCTSGHVELIGIQESDAEWIEKLISLNDLPPQAECEFTVRACYQQRCGPPVDSQNFDTKPKVPLAAPETCGNCFEVQRSGSDDNVNIYFKPLSFVDARGDVTQYRVQYNCDEGGYNQIIFRVKPEMSFVSTQMNRNVSKCVFKVDAGTEAGFNKTLQPAPLVVQMPPKDKELKLPDNFTVIIFNETSVQLHWLPNNSRLLYTIFWQKGQTEGTLNWRELSSRISGHIIVLPAGENTNNYRFGIGMHSLAWNSGIVWSHCSYRYTGTPRSSVVHVIDQTATSALLHVTAPKCLTHVGDTGFVYEHRVNICSLNTTDRCQVSSYSSSLNEIRLNGLQPGNLYRVEVVGVSASGATSQPVFEKFVTAAAPPVVSADIMPVVIASFAVFACFIVVMICLCQKNIRTKCSQWIHEDIVPPKPVKTMHLHPNPLYNTSLSPGYGGRDYDTISNISTAGTTGLVAGSDDGAIASVGSPMSLSSDLSPGSEISQDAVTARLVAIDGPDVTVADRPALPHHSSSAQHSSSVSSWLDDMPSNSVIANLDSADNSPFHHSNPAAISAPASPSTNPVHSRNTFPVNTYTTGRSAGMGNGSGLECEDAPSYSKVHGSASDPEIVEYDQYQSTASSQGSGYRPGHNDYKPLFESSQMPVGAAQPFDAELLSYHTPQTSSSYRAPSVRQSSDYSSVVTVPSGATVSSGTTSDSSLPSYGVVARGPSAANVDPHLHSSSSGSGYRAAGQSNFDVLDGEAKPVALYNGSGYSVVSGRPNNTAVVPSIDLSAFGAEADVRRRQNSGTEISLDSEASYSIGQPYVEESSDGGEEDASYSGAVGPTANNAEAALEPYSTVKTGVVPHYRNDSSGPSEASSGYAGAVIKAADYGVSGPAAPLLWNSGGTDSYATVAAVPDVDAPRYEHTEHTAPIV